MNDVLMFLSMPGGAEWIVILVIALLIFGARLPSVMRSLGKSIVEFKKGMRDVEEDVTNEINRAASDDRTKSDQNRHEAG